MSASGIVILCQNREKHTCFLLCTAPGRTCAAAAGNLLWFRLEAALFPVSVPFALVLGASDPPCATHSPTDTLPSHGVLLPAASVGAGLWEQDGSEQARKDRLKQTGEIWRCWPMILQVAVVHTEPLSDGVRGAGCFPFHSGGDRNGGQTRVKINNCTLTAVRRMLICRLPGLPCWLWVWPGGYASRVDGEPTCPVDGLDPAPLWGYSGGKPPQSQAYCRIMFS